MGDHLTRYQGVYEYQSKRRRYQGKPDICFYIRYRDARGKLIKEKIGWRSEGVTAQLAAHIRNERLMKIRLGEESLPIQAKRKLRMTFATFMEEFYLPWARDNKKRIPDSEEALYRKWIKPVIGEKVLEEIGPLDLEKIKSKMKAEGKSARTIQYALQVVKMAYNRAIEWGKMNNPAASRRVSPLLKQLQLL